MPALRVFLADLWSDWIARLSGIASVILAVIAASRTNPLPNFAFWIAAALCFITAAFRTWRIQYNKVAELKRRLEQLTRVSVTSPALATLEVLGPSTSTNDPTKLEVYVKIPIAVSNPREVATTITLRNWHFEMPGETPQTLCVEFGEATKFRKNLSVLKSSTRNADVGAGQRRDLMVDAVLKGPNQKEYWDKLSGVLYFDDTFLGQTPPVKFSI